MVVRFVRVIRVPACARVSRVSRVCPGSPRCLFTGSESRPRGAVDSGLAAVLAAVESVARFSCGFVSLGFGLSGWL